MSKRPREVVAGMCIDSLEEPQSDPDVDGQDVEVGSSETVKEGAADGSLSEDEDFKRVGVFSRQSDGGRKLVMQLVDVLVERTPMQSPMCPVVEHILEDKEEGYLCEHKGNRGERDLVGGHAEVAADGMEEVDEGEFAGEVGDEYDFGAFPNLSRSNVLVRLQLVLLEVRNHPDYQPRNRSSKVDDLMDQETH